MPVNVLILRAFMATTSPATRPDGLAPSPKCRKSLIKSTRLRPRVDAGDLSAFQAEAGHQAGGTEGDGINIPSRGPRRGPA